MLKKLIFLAIIIQSFAIQAQPAHRKLIYIQDKDIETGAEQISSWSAKVQGKRIGLVAHASSYINETHLVDSMLSLDMNLVKVFAPEHGFRGTASAGAKIEDEKDPKTGLPIISLYGSNKKPKAEQLKDIDIMLFDLQDVGVRFYTYLSTLHYVMQACAENNIPLIILDRPNPNGYYTPGPILRPEYASFVGMHPIPVVHGNTLGEMANMINGEGWLGEGLSCDFEVIAVKGYERRMIYELPRKPSPNLPTKESVYMYPSLCFFEGTDVSVGRGTDYPFQVYGAPFLMGSFQFVPEDREGAMNPKWEGKVCYGEHLGQFAQNQFSNPRNLYLRYLVKAHYRHQRMGIEKPFFNTFFDKLAGTDELRLRIQAGQTEEQILAAWEPMLKAYRTKRKQYLIYPWSAPKN